MKLGMHDNSLFAVLLRSPWWVAGLVAGGAFMAVRLFLPTEFAAFRRVALRGDRGVRGVAAAARA